MQMEWLGYLGTALVIGAYLPQIVHLTKKGCTAGISLNAYLTWSTASVLLLSYAIHQRDPVFIALQGYQLLVTTSILYLSYKHKGQNCDQHGGSCPTTDGPVQD